MKTILWLTTVLTLLLIPGRLLRAADVLPHPGAVELAAYADKLRLEGVKGDQFAARLEQRLTEIQVRSSRAPEAVPKILAPPKAPGTTPAPTLPLKPKDKQAAEIIPLPAPDGTKPAAGAKGGSDMGGFVQQMHAQGLSGRALANAIHTELRRRDVGHGHGKPGGPDGGKVGPPNKGAPGAPAVSETPASKAPTGKPSTPGKGKGKK